MDNQELEKINQFARRELKPEEVYTFKVTLCDNEIDRDFERFSDQALEGLAKMFVGKTGIYDHNPTGKNQWARIYDAQVTEEEGRQTKDGRPYRCLQAKAYMVRTAANEELIAEIEAGIKKEVSVGCSVQKRVCSICGADKAKETCVHQKGKEYQGRVCHLELDEPVDAYEFSFVAVPAQPAAGITKRFGWREEEALPQDALEKLFRGGQPLSPEEQIAAEKAFSRLKAMSLLGEEYLACKRQELLRTAAFCRFPMEQEELEGMSRRLTAGQVDSLTAAIKSYCGGQAPVRQLAPKKEEPGREGLAAFRL